MYPVSGQYLRATRSSHTAWTVCDAWREGTPLAGATDLPVTGGSVTDTAEPGVRLQLDVDLVRKPGLSDLLSPTGTELRVRSVLRYPSGVTESVPMGVFDIDSNSIGYGPGGALHVTASDKWVKVQRAEFLTPRVSDMDTSVPQQIAILLREVLGPDEPVSILADIDVRVPRLVWEGDRAKVINELAASIGQRVFFDRTGVATIAPVPVGQAGGWTVDAGARGVLLDADRATDRTKTRNVVVVTSERASGEPLFAPQVVWDDDPASYTYAGTNPWTGADVGPFGIVPYRYASPVITTGEDALTAGRTILARVVGLNSQLSLKSVRNHALDAFDAITVTLPPERRGLPPTIEQHVIDKITHPLTPDGTQGIETRATRTDTVT